MQQYQLTFIDLALRREALRFGNFTLKSGRQSPYFFNAGLFSDGEAAHLLGGCYAVPKWSCGPYVPAACNFLSASLLQLLLAHRNTLGR